MNPKYYQVKVGNYSIDKDENKINFVSRVIYSTYKKAQYMASKGSAPQKGVSIDKEAEEMLLRVLTQSEFKALDAVKHKLK